MCQVQTMAAGRQLVQAPRRPTFDFTSRWITCMAQQQQLRLPAGRPRAMVLEHLKHIPHPLPCSKTGGAARTAFKPCSWCKLPAESPVPTAVSPSPGSSQLRPPTAQAGRQTHCALRQWQRPISR